MKTSALATLFVLLSSTAFASKPVMKAQLLSSLKANRGMHHEVFDEAGGRTHVHAWVGPRWDPEKSQSYRFDATGQLVKKDTIWRDRTKGRSYDRVTKTYANGRERVVQQAMFDHTISMVLRDTDAKAGAPVRFEMGGSPSIDQLLDKVMAVVDTGRSASFNFSGLEYVAHGKESRTDIRTRVLERRGATP